jgi:hypothetical protein
VKLRGLVSMVVGELGGTEPNTTDPLPENVQLSFSLPQNVYFTPLTVIVLLCAWALPTPKTASIVATEIGSSLKCFIIVRVVLIQEFSPRIIKIDLSRPAFALFVEQRDLTRGWC